MFPGIPSHSADFNLTSQNQYSLQTDHLRLNIEITNLERQPENTQLIAHITFNLKIEVKSPEAASKLPVVFTAEYPGSSGDFNPIFQIEDANQALLTECGVLTTTQDSRIFQVWITDYTSNTGELIMLLPLGIQLDKEILESVFPEGESYLLEVGTPYKLETSNYRLEVVVEQVEYNDPEQTRASQASFKLKVTPV
jgi:hypothetical protein